MKIVKLNRTWLFLALAVGALAAVACGGSATAIPAPTDMPVPVVAAPVANGAEALTAEDEENIE